MEKSQKREITKCPFIRLFAPVLVTFYKKIKKSWEKKKIYIKSYKNRGKKEDKRTFICF